MTYLKARRRFGVLKKRYVVLTYPELKLCLNKCEGRKLPLRMNIVEWRKLHSRMKVVFVLRKRRLRISEKQISRFGLSRINKQICRFGIFKTNKKRYVVLTYPELKELTEKFPLGTIDYLT